MHAGCTCIDGGANWYTANDVRLDTLVAYFALKSTEKNTNKDYLRVSSAVRRCIADAVSFTHLMIQHSS